MEDLASKKPEAFGTTALDQYLEEKFAFIDRFKECQERGQPSTISPPPLPHNNDHHSRYAINNMLSTNGKRIHISVYDTFKPYRSKTSFSPIYRIENIFPDQESIQRVFNRPASEIDVIGVDPGEKNPAAFCRIVREVSAPSTRKDLGTALGESDVTTSVESMSADGASIAEEVMSACIVEDVMDVPVADRVDHIGSVDSEKVVEEATSDEVVDNAEIATRVQEVEGAEDMADTTGPKTVERQVLGRGIEAHNLTITRSSLYAPTVAYRRDMESLKSQHVRVNLGQLIDGSIWANSDPHSDAKTGLPTIHDLESLLLPTAYETNDEMENSHMTLPDSGTTAPRLPFID
ncbi:hypothetical protein BGX28_006510 [Mortierella sp. GBA30]|nr:hypothetical protein BGX28_006510 [Mortierella sp. GBA30]